MATDERRRDHRDDHHDEEQGDHGQAPPKRRRLHRRPGAVGRGHARHGANTVLTSIAVERSSAAGVSTRPGGAGREHLSAAEEHDLVSKRPRQSVDRASRARS